MFKKILFGSILLALLSNSTVNAANMYFAPGIALTNVTATGSNFRGVTPRLTLGYTGRPGPDMVLSGEAFIAFITLPFQENHQPGYTAVKTTADLGVSLLPGLMVTDELQVFLRLGLVSTKFTGGGGNTSGRQVGMGIQTALGKKFDIRAEYDFTDYSTIKKIGKPQTDNFLMNIVYNWD